MMVPLASKEAFYFCFPFKIGCILKKSLQSILFVDICLFICQLESIGALDQFLTKHKKDYVDLHRTTEQERDSIEHEVSPETYSLQVFVWLKKAF